MRRKTFIYSGVYAPVAVGEKYILVECFDANFSSCFSFYPADGIFLGEFDFSIDRYHGWFGFSFGAFLFAHGLREVIAVSEGHYDVNCNFIQKVTVGKDLHPDWD